MCLVWMTSGTSSWNIHIKLWDTFYIVMFHLSCFASSIRKHLVFPGGYSYFARLQNLIVITSIRVHETIEPREECVLVILFWSRYVCFRNYPHVRSPILSHLSYRILSRCWPSFGFLTSVGRELATCWMFLGNVPRCIIRIAFGIRDCGPNTIPFHKWLISRY
jgi:hypothetical protein